MATYSNGRVPDSVLNVILGSGYDANGFYAFQCTAAFAARWTYAKQYALSHFGRTIYISTGWNIYRPFDVQVDARNRACATGNCDAAAYQGSSSHGGNYYYNGASRDCLAVDVNPNGLSWNQVDEAMVAAGFAAGLITSGISGIPGGEPWHYIDFNAFGPVPTFGGSTPYPQDKGFLMALSDAQQAQVYDALVKHSPSGDYYTTDAIINILRGEVEIQIASLAAGNIMFPGAGYLAFPAVVNTIREADGKPVVNVDVDEEALARTLAPLLSENISSLTDADVQRIAKAAGDELSKRLAA